MKGGSSKRPHKRSNSSIPDSLEETESSCCNDDRQSDSEVGGKLRRKQTPNGTPKDSESDTSTVENNPNVSTDTESTPGAKDDGMIKSAEGATEGEMNMNVETAPVEIPVVEQNGVVSGVTELHHSPKDVTQEVDECNNNGPKILVRTDTDEQNDDQQPEKSDEDPIKTVDVEIKAATEDDIPLGLEADSLNTEKGIDYEKYPPVDKRLGWLIGNSENVSFTSDQSQLTNTSTSSDISLDMLLQERSADPEEILTSLGFGGSEETDPTIQRVPNRFLSQPSAADGIDLTSLLDDNNELRKLLELSENGDLMEQINLSQQNTSMMNQGKFDNLDSIITCLLYIKCVPAHFINAERLSQLNVLDDNANQVQDQSQSREDVFQNKGHEIHHTEEPHTDQSCGQTGQGCDRPESLDVQQSTSKHRYDTYGYTDSPRSLSSCSSPILSVCYDVKLSSNESLV